MSRNISNCVSLLASRVFCSHSSVMKFNQIPSEKKRQRRTAANLNVSDRWFADCRSIGFNSPTADRGNFCDLRNWVNAKRSFTVRQISKWFRGPKGDGSVGWLWVIVRIQETAESCWLSSSMRCVAPVRWDAHGKTCVYVLRNYTYYEFARALGTDE